jgi:hypothetical protein
MTYALCLSLLVAAAPVDGLGKIKKLEGNWTTAEAQLNVRVLSGAKAASFSLTDASRSIEHLFVFFEEGAELKASYFGAFGIAKFKTLDAVRFESIGNFTLFLKMKGDSEMTVEISKPGSPPYKKVFNREYVDALK